MVDFLRHLLFESLPLLLIAEVIALGIAVAVHRRRLTRGSRRALWITLAVCVLMPMVQALVVTDREAIEATIRAMAHAADQGDVPAIAEHIDENFHGGAPARQDLVDAMNHELQRLQIDAPRVTILEIALEGDQAKVRFRVFSDIRVEGQAAYDNVPSLWRVRLLHRGAEWRLLDIEDAQIGPGTLLTRGGQSLMPHLNLGLRP